jgi:hypothetical protein
MRDEKRSKEEQVALLEELVQHMRESAATLKDPQERGEARSAQLIVGELTFRPSADLDGFRVEDEFVPLNDMEALIAQLRRGA